MSKLPFVTAALLLPTLALAAAEPPSSDKVDAQGLYSENCLKCHGPEVYTRADRRIQSLDALHGQVRMCEQNLGLSWFDDEIDAVASMLNKKYYKFDQ
jgi:mono/diheme cytochrome c family protein